MFQDFANTLGAEEEVYYYWFTLFSSFKHATAISRIPGDSQGDVLLPTLVIGRKVQEEGETINHDISGEETTQPGIKETMTSSYIKNNR